MPRGRPKKIVESPVEPIIETKKTGRGRTKNVQSPEKMVNNLKNITKEKPKEKVFDTKKILLIVDMQNDFITGSLANKAAEKIVNPICEFIKNYDGEIIFTQDTHHDDDYLDSFEGKRLPIKHCIVDTEGWQINKKLTDAAENAGHQIRTAWKFYFGGGENIYNVIYNNFKEAPDILDIVGTCTDICVVSNALQLRSLYPDTEINVYANLCAGLTTKKHNAALEVMRSCQINIIEDEIEKTL